MLPPPRISPEWERVRALLCDTVAMLCKNGLSFNRSLRVQGLLGVTVDDRDIFLVQINDCMDSGASALGNSAPCEREKQSQVVSETPVRGSRGEKAGSSARSSKAKGRRVHHTNAESFGGSGNERRGNHSGGLPTITIGSSSSVNDPFERLPKLEVDLLDGPDSGRSQEQLSARKTLLMTNDTAILSHGDDCDNAITIKDEDVDVCYPSAMNPDFSVYTKEGIRVGGAGASSNHNSSTTSQPGWVKGELDEEGLEEYTACSGEDGFQEGDGWSGEMEGVEYEGWEGGEGWDEGEAGAEGSAAAVLQTLAKRTINDVKLEFYSRRLPSTTVSKQQHQLRQQRWKQQQQSGASSDPSSYCATKSLHVCAYPGCNKQFLHKQHLLRHQTQKHGRPPKHVIAYRKFYVPNAARGGALHDFVSPE